MSDAVIIVPVPPQSALMKHNTLLLDNIRHREAVSPVGILRVIYDVQPIQMLLLSPQEGLAEEQA